MNEEWLNPTTPKEEGTTRDIKLSISGEIQEISSYMSCGGYNNRDIVKNEHKTQDTHPSRDTQASQDTQDKIKKLTTLDFLTKFEPECIKRARENPSLEALELIIAWAKKKQLTENQRLRIVQTFLKFHCMQLTDDELLEILATPAFSCDMAQRLGFCNPERCWEHISPADRLILAFESAILFHSTGELDLRIAGIRKIVPLKKIFKRARDGQHVNTALFDEIFIECFYVPPNPPFTDDDALKVYMHWLEHAEIIRDAIDSDSALEELLIEILTTKRDIYAIELLKEGIPPYMGFFADSKGVLYVESSLLRELLFEAGVRERPEKIAKACRRILAGKAKQYRISKNGSRSYFWRFNLHAIQAIMKQRGEKWDPEIKETFEIKDVVERIGFDFKTQKEQNDKSENKPESDLESTKEEIIDVWNEIQGVW